MNALPSNGDLTLAYEALRAQATGQLPASTPRGLALFLTMGCPAWMHAWQPLATAVRITPAVPHQVEPSAGLDHDVVHVLAQMALGCQRRTP
jgi:hypothetical protein